MQEANKSVLKNNEEQQMEADTKQQKVHNKQTTEALLNWFIILACLLRQLRPLCGCSGYCLLITISRVGLVVYTATITGRVIPEIGPVM